MKLKWLSFMLAAVIALAGCVEGEDIEDVDQEGTSEEGSESVEIPEEAEGGDMLTIARSGDVEIMDPGYASNEEDIDVLYHMFDGLVHYKNDELDVEPALATEWDVSEDGQTWTFELREGVQFHDGTDFNADAVVQSFMRVLDEGHDLYGLIEGGYSYLDYLMGDVLEEVVEVGEYEVEFHLNQEFAPFITYMAYYSQYIISPTALEEDGAGFLENPVGTGPFKFSEWQRGEYVILEANEDYWGDVPDIDTLVFQAVPESSTRLMELQSGGVDAVKNVSPQQVELIEEDDDLNLITTEGASIFFADINTRKEPFDNLEVRRALNHAVNTEQLVNHIYGGMATEAINFVPPAVPSFDEEAGPYEYDPEKARELLAEAGYEDGFEMELYTFESARAYVSQPVQAAELIAADLQAVGIDVQILPNEWATHASIMDNGEHGISLTGWFDIAYPSNFLNALALQGTRTGYDYGELHDTALAALSTYDEEEQEVLYREMQHELHDSATIIPLAHSNYLSAVSSEVEGLEVNSAGNIIVRDASKE